MNSFGPFRINMLIWLVTHWKSHGRSLDLIVLEHYQVRDPTVGAVDRGSVLGLELAVEVVS